MTYSLPFGLTQKPVRKYFDGGSIGFSCRDGGKLYYTITLTWKSTGFTKETFAEKEVKSKEHLDRLLAVKTSHEIQTIEVVA